MKYILSKRNHISSYIFHYSSFSTNMSSLKSSPGLKNSVSIDTSQIVVSSAVDPSGQVIVVSSGLSSSGGDSSQTSQGSYRRAMENIITDYR